MQQYKIPFKRNEMVADKWLETARGRLFLQQERRQLKAVMPAVLGYRMLQIGRWGLSADTAGGSAILRHWIMDVQPSAEVSAVVDTGNLPVASRSVDAVLLPHSLELTEHPHRLLREADRVLCDRGQIILLGFNPYNPVSFMRYWPARSPWYPKLQHLYSLGRTSDWLGLLDYEIEQTIYYGRSFPWVNVPAKNGTQGNELTKTWRHLLDSLGQAYLVFARKRVIPLTPARRRWEARPQLGPMAMPEARVSRVTYLRDIQTTSEQ